MKYKQLRQLFGKHPYFTKAFIKASVSSEKTVNNQLNRWIKDGDVIRLKKGIFTLAEKDRQVGLSKKLVANILYAPSYISLQYALSFYGLIPEAVYTVTSVATKKTQIFNNDFGEFKYQHVKPELFFGYTTIKDEHGFDCLIAEPEKALLDFLYLEIDANKVEGVSFFEDSLRLQNIEQLNWKKMETIATKIDSKKINSIILKMKKWMGL